MKRRQLSCSTGIHRCSAQATVQRRFIVLAASSELAGFSLSRPQPVHRLWLSASILRLMLLRHKLRRERPCFFAAQQGQRERLATSSMMSCRVIEGRRMRVDTTVVETNIHYPTDSSLLGDGVRVLTRIMKKITKIAGAGGTELRDRSRTVQLRYWRLRARRAPKAGRAKRS